VTDDRVYLIYISECITNIRELTASGREAFWVTKHDQAAVFYYLQTLAESTQRLSEALKANHPEINWAVIAGFRNRLVHGYLSVNLKIVWDIIENDLEPLREAVEVMQHELDKTDAPGNTGI
jgi:uncharacterized protein with HEPN domain